MVFSLVSSIKLRSAVYDAHKLYSIFTFDDLDPLKVSRRCDATR